MTCAITCQQACNKYQLPGTSIANNPPACVQQQQTAQLAQHIDSSILSITSTLPTPQIECIPACMPACLPECTEETVENTEVTPVKSFEIVANYEPENTNLSVLVSNEGCLDQCLRFVEKFYALLHLHHNLLGMFYRLFLC
uniref:Uncharacterized protein n=1 Tax=Parascaris equorum TaxID=6256 RepID=A0A914RV20_PAREQ